MRQLIVHSDIKYISDTCSSYVLIDGYLNQDRVRKKIGDVYDVIGAPFISEKEYDQANRYIVALTKRFVAEFGGALNEFHSINYSLRQWEVVMGLWVYHTLFDIYSKYTKLKKINKDNLVIYGIKNYIIENRANDYINTLTHSQEKNAYLWSYIAEKMGFNVDYSKNTETYSFTGEVYRGAKSYLKIKTKKFLKFIQSFKFSNDCNSLLINLPFPRRDLNKIELDSRGRIRYFFYEDVRRSNLKIINSLERDEACRDFLLNRIGFDSENEFEKIAVEFLTLNCPISYIEGFKKLYNWAKKMCKKISAKKIYTCYSGIEVIDFMCANFVEKGIKIYEIQHSAAYGGMKNSFVGEMIFADYFLTWGWEMDLSDYMEAKLKPVSMVRYPIRCDDLVIKRNKILLTCNFSEICDIGWGWYYGRYVENTLNFIGALERKNQEELVVRMDLNDFLNVELALQIEKKFPWVEIEDRYAVPYVKSVMESKFIVSDYYGSTHLEALMLGVPFMMFNSQEIISMNDSLKEFFGKLKEEGIFYNSGIELADTINSIMDMSWFQQNKKKELYEAYLGKFVGNCSTNQELLDKWIEEFNKM